MTDLITVEDAKKLLDGATPGPWQADGEPWNRIVWSSADNRVCFMAHSSGLNDARDIATSELVAAAPGLAHTVIALHDQLADAEAAQAAVVERCVGDEVDYWKQMLEKAEECLASANSIKNVIAAERDCLAAENASLKARGAGARNAAMLDCVRIVAEERNKQEPGPLFKVLNEAMGKIEDARFAPTKTESPGELVEALRAISMAQSLSVAQQTALKLIKDLGGQND